MGDLASGGALFSSFSRASQNAGAYPSAQFESAGGENVPVGDNLGPFEPQLYFDGSRVRTQASADALANSILPL